MKVQYPGVADSLSSDLAVVKPVALQVFGLKNAEVEPHFAEVKLRLLEETDCPLELERSMALSRATEGRVPRLRFPKYDPELSNRRVLTMDRTGGCPRVFLSGACLSRRSSECSAIDAVRSVP